MKLLKQSKTRPATWAFFIQEYADNWAQQALIESNGGNFIMCFSCLP